MELAVQAMGTRPPIGETTIDVGPGAGYRGAAAGAQPTRPWAHFPSARQGTWVGCKEGIRNAAMLVGAGEQCKLACLGPFQSRGQVIAQIGQI